MSVLRICTHLDSDTLHLPGLRSLIGKDVEIIIRERRRTAAAPEAWEEFSAAHPGELVDPDVYAEYRRSEAQTPGAWER